MSQQDAPLNFNAKESYRTLVPNGTYLCGITGVEEKESKEGQKFMVFTFTILEGEHKGAVCSVWVNYWAEAAQTRGFAHQTLANICRAAGIDVLNQFTDLMNTVMRVEWGQKGEFNQLKKFLPMDGIESEPAKAVAGAADTW